jgi:hypothetical protein
MNDKMEIKHVQSAKEDEIIKKLEKKTIFLH